MDELSVELFPGLGYDCNIYLLGGEVLVDAGTGHNFSNLLHWLKERTDPLDIHTLILTHRHYDHTGGAEDVILETGCTAYIHELDAAPLLTGDSVTTGARSFKGEQQPIDVITFEEGHEFRIGDNRFEVIHTPGHTIGSISLFDRDQGILFPGDVLFVNGGVGRWDLATGSHADLARSIDRLAELDVRDLYPGHDVPVMGNGKEHVQLAQESMRESPFELMMRRLKLLKTD
jgi:hydroxyacylglutathione hydrolase